MKKVALFIAATFLLLTLAILPVKVKGQVYKKVTTAPDDWTGTYLIVWENGTESRIGANNSGNYLGAFGPVVISNNTIEGSYSSNEVIVVKNGSSGYYIKRGNQYLNSNSKGSNNTWYAKFENSNTYGTWTLAANGIFLGSLKQLKYNIQNTRFLTAYSSNNYYYTALLYKRQPEEKEILGAGTGNNDKYYLIASPVTTLTPSMTNGFLREDGDVDYYDLYSFDQSNDDEWRNYKINNFSLATGKGYLYANKDDVTLVFDGAFHNHNNETVNLAYTAGQKLAGWNLIGNPFDVTAYLTDGRDFLRMNAAGDGFIASSGSINAMEGVFVQATGTGQSVTFTITAPSSKDEQNERVALNLIGNDDNVIDRAIVRFGEGGTLSKLTLKENSTKIYIPQEDGDFAVVRSNGKENIPVNFKASKIGRYTISVETEGVNMNYLHLIDRLTGKDTDLLIENKYSFIASQSDIESRFILSFGNNGYESSTDGTFAYQNGSDIVVRGEGELQVFDVMGRMVMQQCVNGEEIVSVQSQGVYVFRLNGKTQKIVVR